MIDQELLKKATQTEAWGEVKKALLIEIGKLKSIDLILALSEKEKSAYEATKDPIRIGQMLAYRTLNNILEGLIGLEDTRPKKSLDDYL